MGVVQQTSFQTAKIVGAGILFSPSQSLLVKTIGSRISNPIVFQDVPILQFVSLLQEVQQPFQRPVLRLSKRHVMITLKFDSDRIVAKIFQTVPHTYPCMVCPILGIKDAIDPPILPYEIMSVAASSYIAAIPHL